MFGIFSLHVEWLVVQTTIHGRGVKIINPNQEKALNDLIGQKIEMKCKKCDNMLYFDTLSVFMGGETIICAQCKEENHLRTDKHVLENYLSLFPDKKDLN